MLKEKLLEDLKESMKEKNTIRKNVVQMVRAAILQVEKDKHIEVSDDKIVEIIAKEAKKRKDSLEDFQKSGREDLIEQINKEIEILNEYLPKQLTQEELEQKIKEIIAEVGATSIKDIGYETNTNIIGYYKYICILSENKLKQYNASGKLENELEVKINVPIYDAKGKYLVIGEKNSRKVYLICDNSIVWETEVEGNVSKIDVNENGYVSIILKGTTYKSVIVVYDAKGNELFKTYLSKTSAVDACISKDNKYLSFAEVNTTGTVIQSNIKTISMDKAKQEPSQAIVYTYAANSNDLIINLKYHDKNKLICMYDNSIHLITNDIDENIMQLDENTKKAAMMPVRSMSA